MASCTGVKFARTPPKTYGNGTTAAIPDALAVLDFQFNLGAAPPCLKAADFNDDGWDDILVIGRVVRGRLARGTTVLPSKHRVAPECASKETA